VKEKGERDEIQLLNNSNENDCERLYKFPPDNYQELEQSHRECHCSFT
jgi:hypothetical protein